jgi:hypothetical protein
MKQTKNFDAVEMMRDIREKLSAKYWQKPDVLKKEMKNIQKKYNLNSLSVSKV